MLDLSIIQLKGLVKRMTGVAGYRADSNWTAQHEMALLDLIKMELTAKILAGNDVPTNIITAEIFGTSTCPYCEKAKALLTEKGIHFVYKNMDDEQSGFFDQLVGRIKSWKTVPQIFLGSEHVGGYDDLLSRFELVPGKVLNDHTVTLLTSGRSILNHRTVGEFIYDTGDEMIPKNVTYVGEQSETPPASN